LRSKRKKGVCVKKPSAPSEKAYRLPIIPYSILIVGSVYLYTSRLKKSSLKLTRKRRKRKIRRLWRRGSGYSVTLLSQ
jgi:hypothetical protein